MATHYCVHITLSIAPPTNQPYFFSFCHSTTTFINRKKGWLRTSSSFSLVWCCLTLPLLLPLLLSLLVLCCCFQLSYIYERVFYGQNIIFYLGPYGTTTGTLVGGTFAYKFVTINCEVNASTMIGKQNGFLETMTSIETSTKNKSNDTFCLKKYVVLI